MLYSLTAHSNGASGFLFDEDKNAPSDAFPVQESDAQKAINTDGSYSFTAPASGEEFGTLTITPKPAPTAAEKLANAATAKTAELTSACKAAIVGGYQSSALGSTHIYPSQPEDQANMQASVVDSLLPGKPSGWTTPFTCVVPANEADAQWPMENHTAAQIQQAGSDGKAWITAQRIQLRTLVGQVDAIVKANGAVSDIEAIAWTNGTP